MSYISIVSTTQKLNMTFSPHFEKLQTDWNIEDGRDTAPSFSGGIQGPGTFSRSDA